MNTNAEKLILEMQRRAEQRLQAQQDIALASDARALTFCGLCLTAGSLLVGLADGEYAIAFYAAGLALYLAAGCAAYAARPTRWAAPGQFGSDYEEDLAGDRDYLTVVQEVSAHVDDQIRRNDSVLDSNGRLMGIGTHIAVASPVVGLVVMVVLWGANACGAW